MSNLIINNQMKLTFLFMIVTGFISLPTQAVGLSFKRKCITKVKNADCRISCFRTKKRWTPSLREGGDMTKTRTITKNVQCNVYSDNPDHYTERVMSKSMMGELLFGVPDYADEIIVSELLQTSKKCGCDVITNVEVYDEWIINP